jgi:hypothetical protein
MIQKNNSESTNTQSLQTTVSGSVTSSELRLGNLIYKCYPDAKRMLCLRAIVETLIKNDNTMKTVTVKKGSTVESNFGTKHEVLADFKATVLDRQHVEPLEPYFICLNDGKFESGLEEPFADLGQGQAFFVNERDVVQA